MKPFKKDLLKDIVLSKPVSRICIKEFMIAWSGVPVLVYSGFSASLMRMKEEIGRLIPTVAPEGPGSKWPKTSLGCLNEGDMLTIDELKLLRAICDQFNALISTNDCFYIDQVTLVTYQCRSLEKRLISDTLQLDTDGLDGSVSEEVVNEITAEFEENNLGTYLGQVNSPGHRLRYYRDSAVGSTLIHDIYTKCPEYLHAFIEEVDERLPDKYNWFAPSSYHIALRALS